MPHTCGALFCALVLCGCGGSGTPVVTSYVPTVTSISPNTGPSSGGTKVTVNGSHFKYVVPVLAQFGSIQADATKINVLSDTQLTLVAPPGSGTVDVRIQTGSGTSPVVSADKYTYTGAGNYVFDFAFSVGAVAGATGANVQSTAIATAANGNVYVADTGTNTAGLPAPRVDEYNSQGNFLETFGSYGTGNGQFTQIVGIAVAPTGNVYVLDHNSSNSTARVETFDSQGNYVSQFTVSSPGVGITGDIAIATDQAGNVYVATTAYSVTKYNSQGSLLLQFGSQGTGNGQFSLIASIAVDSSGNIYVSDDSYGFPGPTYAHRVEKFGSQGNYLLQFGTALFTAPQSIGFSSTGSVFVSDFGQSVYVFDGSGNLLGEFGAKGTGSGQFSDISGIAVGSANNVYVLNSIYPQPNIVEVFQPSND
jgi:hypothetical protein